MDTAEIEVFLVLAEELHFGRTAERLRLPQPRVSRWWPRSSAGRAARCSSGPAAGSGSRPLGQQLASQLRPAYAQLTAALDDARAAARQAAGVVRIGFSPTSNMTVLTRLTEAFEARHPGSRAVLDVVRTSTRTRRCAAASSTCWSTGWRWTSPTSPPGRCSSTATGCWPWPAVTRWPPGPRSRSRTSPDREVAQMTPPFPPALYDAIFPPRAPSGREIRRGQPVRSIHELVSLVARGQIVHPTASGIPMFTRDDIALVPITDLPPLPLGLIWVTAHENARIRALAQTARSIG